MSVGTKPNGSSSLVLSSKESTNKSSIDKAKLLRTVEVLTIFGRK
jgi:hypothetical protein